MHKTTDLEDFNPIRTICLLVKKNIGCKKSEVQVCDTTFSKPCRNNG